MISSFEKSLRASGILASDISIIKEIMMLGSLIPVNSVVFIPNDGLVAFHYSSSVTFCLYSKSSIIYMVVLPTTEIIEPVFCVCLLVFSLSSPLWINIYVWFFGIIEKSY